MSRDAIDRMEILLIEDNLENANGTIQALKRGNVQCRVSLVCDGEEAIASPPPRRICPSPDA